jgi:hypothetical protein
MSNLPQPHSGYREAIQAAYFGERGAERVYRLLSEGCEEPTQREKFKVIADIEQLTANTLAPLARRLGVVDDEVLLAAHVAQRLAELQPLSWTAFIQQAARKWPPYVGEFEALAAQAPPGDADAMQLLVAHERALVRFVEIEIHSPGSAKSLQPLKSLLALMPRVASARS